MFSLRPEFKFLEKDLIRIEKKVSVNREIAEIIRQAEGKPVLFENVILRNGEYSKYPVLANVVGRKEYLAKYLGIKVQDISHFLLDVIEERRKPEIVNAEMYEENEVDLNKLPILFHYPRDGGYYISAGIVVAWDREYGFNASYHRMMQISSNEVVVRIVPRQLYKFIERGLRKFTICIGNTPQVMIASAMSPKIGVSELDIANAIRKIRLIDFNGIVGTEAEIVMIGEITGETYKEGPFIDLTGTYDIIREQPIVKIKKIYARKNAFYQAILPGDYEHKLLMGLSREPTILREVLRDGIDCRDVHMTLGGSSWLHCIVQIKKRHREDGVKTINAAFRGHSSLKFVVVVEEDINIYDPNDVEWAIATRVQPDRDIYIFPDQIGSSLDPSADQITRKTAKWGIDATIHDSKRKNDFMKII